MWSVVCVCVCVEEEGVEEEGGEREGIKYKSYSR